MDINEIIKQVTEEVYKRLGENQEAAPAADVENAPLRNGQVYRPYHTETRCLDR